MYYISFVKGIHLFSGNADQLMEKLDNDLLDFGIVIDPTDKNKYDYLRLPSVDKWGVLMRNDCPLADKSFIEPEDLFNLPLIISRQAHVDNELSNWLGRDLNNFNIVATYNLLYNASLLVDENVGYALCLDRLINTTGESNLCFRALKPQLEARLNIIWKKSQIFSNASKLFINKLKENIKA
ncbi:LysR family transcriptional regulator substrate-binding protein [Bacillus sp. FJAT-50079]|uniref:LysR family transcriptional regulator substrate-binding protein n=1 Tax=Bacillus sp. FJAT-50079 TaxID=2833577 RepID=UPI001BC93859|nr:LysR family transcriptional regulator substrate-binding protein [Bacillus sp. FJAT-50079]MBS4210421.1 LysR family transcriptional regulator substrate-binding protein [Bacillus sp. FJAT-50079]